MKFNFTIQKKDPCGARQGLIETSHGCFETPVFMPVGTRGVVKTINPAQLKDANTPILLSNTYHLALRPGDDVVFKLGGLHRFMAWDGPILTDSGGFQIFSLAMLCKINDEEVVFRSHIDGSLISFGPEKVIEIQRKLGSDIVMPLDHCSPWPSPYEKVENALRRTLLWARRSKECELADWQTLFGIVQGGTFPDLRIEAASRLVDIGFEGYAIGGLSVGEPKSEMVPALEACLSRLPLERPRYFMGVGFPLDILLAVERGVDMFDCVIPTRNARGGGAFTWKGEIQIRNACYKEDPNPIEEDCPCYACRTFSRSYLHHLFCKKVEEILGLTMLTLHNLTFFQRLTSAIRDAIRQGRFLEFSKNFRENSSYRESSY